MTSRRDMQADANAADLRRMGVVTNAPVSSAEIDATMLAVIRACMLDKMPVERIHFHRALVPDSEIDHRFPRLLAIAKQTKGRR